MASFFDFVSETSKVGSFVKKLEGSGAGKAVKKFKDTGFGKLLGGIFGGKKRSAGPLAAAAASPFPVPSAFAQQTSMPAVEGAASSNNNNLILMLFGFFLLFFLLFRKR